MALSGRLSLFLTLLVILGLFAMSCENASAVREMAAGDAGVAIPDGLCEQTSKTFSYACIKSSSCATQCQKYEKAVTGACHIGIVKPKCYCYIKC